MNGSDPDKAFRMYDNLKAFGMILAKKDLQCTLKGYGKIIISEQRNVIEIYSLCTQ